MADAKLGFWAGLAAVPVGFATADGITPFADGFVELGCAADELDAEFAGVEVDDCVGSTSPTEVSVEAAARSAFVFNS